MKDKIYAIWSRFLTWFSKLKITHSLFAHIPFISYESNLPYVNGEDILQLMEILQPGDVLLRGYDSYVDGKFIPDEKGYSHAGLYVGNNEVIHASSPTVNRTTIIDFCQCDRIMALRPMSGQVIAIVTANNLIGLPYDFNYESDLGKLYCFELISQCYPDSMMELFKVSKFLGLVKRECYLAKSIYENSFFDIMFEKNKKID